MRISTSTGIAAIVAAIGIVSVSGLAEAQKKPKEPTEPKYGTFPDNIKFPLTNDQLPKGLKIPEVSSTLPLNVEFPVTSNNPQQKLFQLQQAFDVFAWKTFIALNWPANTDEENYGKPDKSMKIGSVKDKDRDRVWETFIPPRLIFKDHGAAPDPYKPGAPRKNEIHSISKRAHLLNEVDEAFFNLEKPLPPILDTNLEYARYEIRINETEYDYIVKGPSTGKLVDDRPLIINYPLYSIAGQKKFINSGGKIVLPSGSIEIKAAWKKLTAAEINSKRFYAQKVDVDENPFAEPPVTKKGVMYGLVGLHIMYLVEGIPQWVWPTFEHVDNAPLADLRESPHRITGEWHVPDPKDPQNWKRRPVKAKYSFYDLGNGERGRLSVGGFSPSSRAAMDAANVIYSSNSGSANYYQYKQAVALVIPARVPSQIAKVITDNNAIVASKWTYALNEAIQKKLKEIDPNNVWANYRLVTTQWPSNPGLTAEWEKYLMKQKPPKLLGAGTIRAGNPAPISLGNAVAETYMQINGSCMNCHSGATLNFEYSTGPFKGSKPDADFSFMLQRAK